ncbi:hypothetical protein [Phocaeicola coprocola]|uniref:hypothetical protein n=1 Tax=Phocaeicola coprocola TaxID=310298 RepID=UPI002942D08C|nr:hypothetical protein [Phocaeicola coprocola]
MENRKNIVIVEPFIWLIIGTLITLFAYGEDFLNFTISSIESIHALILLSCFGFFPFFFELLTGKYPFELLRSIIFPSREQHENSSNELNNNEDADICNRYIKYYGKTANLLLNKSNKYIAIGYFLALSGVLVFILLTGQMNISNEINYKLDSLKEINILNYVVYLITINLPRFGVLFFIEYIAIFFLQQYRVLLEEFRYYKLIECNLIQYQIIIRFINEYENTPEIIDKFIKYIDSHSIMIPNITGSHKIKTEKLVYDDLDLLSKVTSLIQAVKSNGKATD